jgi:hypothetical protein
MIRLAVAFMKKRAGLCVIVVRNAIKGKKNSLELPQRLLYILVSNGSIVM